MTSDKHYLKDTGTTQEQPQESCRVEYAWQELEAYDAWCKETEHFRWMCRRTAQVAKDSDWRAQQTARVIAECEFYAKWEAAKLDYMKRKTQHILKELEQRQ
jgi:hypothetical protein